MMSAGCGLVWLAFMGLNCRVVVPCEMICAAFVAWGLIEAGQTHEVLACTRAELLKDIRIVVAPRQCELQLGRTALTGSTLVENIKQIRIDKYLVDGV